jgi:sugar phosphate isomerase/epimerase
MNIGLQLYSVKTFMKADEKDTLKQVADMGYNVVEIAGLPQASAEEFKAWCDELGLKVNSAHVGMALLEDDKYEDTIKYLKTIGCTRYIVPGGMPYATKEDMDYATAWFNKYQPILEKEGMELMFHNHNGEFLPNQDGQLPHVELQKRTNIRFQIDVYWSYRGGVNPMYVLEQLKDRIDVIHLKDGTMQGGSPLGMGEVDIKGIYAWAEKNGIDMVVENEPVAEVEMSEAKICIDFLK